MRIKAQGKGDTTSKKRLKQHLAIQEETKN
jgi:hypothetical protein